MLLEYPIWMWHWATPGDAAVPWDRLRAVPLAAHAVERKAAAAQCYRSQIEVAAADTGAVAAAVRVAATTRRQGGGVLMTTRLSTGYFDRIYSESADPWQLGDRWYEQRKYAITLALLPYRRYRHAFEPGCSIGVLTEQLATRCDHVTSTDIASAALDATHRRLVNAGSAAR